MCRYMQCIVLPSEKLPMNLDFYRLSKSLKSFTKYVVFNCCHLTLKDAPYRPSEVRL